MGEDGMVNSWRGAQEENHRGGGKILINVNIPSTHSDMLMDTLLNKQNTVSAYVT